MWRDLKVDLQGPGACLTEGVDDDDEKNANPANSVENAVELWSVLAQNILRLPRHVYYKVTNIKYFLQHNIYDMHTVYHVPHCIPIKYILQW